MTTRKKIEALPLPSAPVAPAPAPVPSNGKNGKNGNGKRSNGNGNAEALKRARSMFPKLSAESPYREHIDHCLSTGEALPDYVSAALKLDGTGMTPAPAPQGKRSNGKKKIALDASDAPSAPAPSKGKKTPAPAPAPAPVPAPSAPSKGKKTPAPSAPAPQYPSRAKAMMGAFDKLGDDAEEGKHFKLERNGSGFDLITLVPVGKSGGKKTPAPAPSAGKKTPAPEKDLSKAQTRTRHFEAEEIDAHMLDMIRNNPNQKVGVYRAIFRQEHTYAGKMLKKALQGVMRASINRLVKDAKIIHDRDTATYSVPSNGKKTPAPSNGKKTPAPSAGKKTPAPAPVPAPAPAPSNGKRSRIRAK